MGRLIGVALAVLVGGCGTTVDLGDSKRGVGTNSGGTGGASTGGESGADGGEVAPPMGSGGTPTAPPSGGEGGNACAILPDPDPLPLNGTAAENCAEALDATDWQLPETSAPGADPNDKRVLLVGRWVPCGVSPLGPAGTAGIEFGGNGRFRWLQDDASGELTPGTESGNYYLFTFFMGEASAQLNLETQNSLQLLSHFRIRPNAQAIQANGVIYGRTEPSPENGRDNPPPVRASSCSLVGTWDTTTADPSNPPVALWFDDQGHFFGGTVHSDVCARPFLRGTYELTADDMFSITTARGMDACEWLFGARYSAAFSPDCNAVTMTTVTDNCTGGRGYLNGTTSLARRASR